jgi:predicted  nucleic acid-binding Zn-ribbon protein
MPSLEDLEREISVLKLRLQDMKTEPNRLKALCEQKDEVLKQEREEYRTLQERCRAAEDRLNKLQAECLDLKGQLEAIKGQDADTACDAELWGSLVKIVTALRHASET